MAEVHDQKDDGEALFPPKEELFASKDDSYKQEDEQNEANEANKDKDQETDANEASEEAVQTVDDQEQDAKVLSEVEQEAIKSGWLPKESFKGDPALWVSAAEFNRRGKLIDRIGSQHKELENMRKANEHLVSLVKKQGERLTREKAQEALEKKHQAIAEGDIEGAEFYEKQHKEYEDETLGYTQQEQQTPPEEYKEFARLHKDWLNTETPENQAMTVFADRTEEALKNEHPSWSTQERLNEVEKRVKDTFAHRFREDRPRRAPAVEQKTAAPMKKNSKISFSDLPSEAKAIVNQMVKADRSKSITRDEYAQQLLLTGAVKIDK